MDRFVARRNIDHFHQQLEAERDPARRANLERLLAEAQQQLSQAEEAHRETRR